ncbi:hypothetical protein BKA93DRAFT_751748 [Sparassis latifolia]
MAQTAPGNSVTVASASCSAHVWGQRRCWSEAGRGRRRVEKGLGGDDVPRRRAAVSLIWGLRTAENRAWVGDRVESSPGWDQQATNSRRPRFHLPHHLSRRPPMLPAPLAPALPDDAPVRAAMHSPSCLKLVATMGETGYVRWSRGSVDARKVRILARGRATWGCCCGNVVKLGRARMGARVKVRSAKRMVDSIEHAQAPLCVQPTRTSIGLKICLVGIQPHRLTLAPPPPARAQKSVAMRTVTWDRRSRVFLVLPRILTPWRRDARSAPQQ